MPANEAVLTHDGISQPFRSLDLIGDYGDLAAEESLDSSEEGGDTPNTLFRSRGSESWRSKTRFGVKGCPPISRTRAGSGISSRSMRSQSGSGWMTWKSLISADTRELGADVAYRGCHVQTRPNGGLDERASRAGYGIRFLDVF